VLSTRSAFSIGGRDQTFTVNRRRRVLAVAALVLAGLALATTVRR
jgi:hypothetical protein